jgi:hypothetical protein
VAETGRVVEVLGGLFFGGGLVGGDGVAECFELVLEASRAMLDRVALPLPVGAEVVIWDLVADDVVVGNEQVVPDRADRFLFTTTAAELGEVRGEVGVLRADGSAGAFGQLRGQPARPGPGSPGFPAAG